MTWRTVTDANDIRGAACRLLVRAAEKRNTPIKMSQPPFVAMERPRAPDQAPTIKPAPISPSVTPNPIPTSAACLVARLKSLFQAHSPARKTRPPSNGNPGTRLNSPSCTFTMPSKLQRTTSP